MPGVRFSPGSHAAVPRGFCIAEGGFCAAEPRGFCAGHAAAGGPGVRHRRNFQAEGPSEASRSRASALEARSSSRLSGSTRRLDLRGSRAARRVGSVHSGRYAREASGPGRDGGSSGSTRCTDGAGCPPGRSCSSRCPRAGTRTSHRSPTVSSSPLGHRSRRRRAAIRHHEPGGRSPDCRPRLVRGVDA